jgi:hypothetical protein
MSPADDLAAAVLLRADGLQGLRRNSMRKLPRKARVALTAVWVGMLTLGLVGVPGTTDTALATGTTTVTVTTTVKDVKTVTATVYKTVTETVTTTVKDVKTVTATVTATVTKVLTTTVTATKAACNAGGGNGSEGCDPGNSGNTPAGDVD